MDGNQALVLFGLAVVGLFLIGRMRRKPPQQARVVFVTTEPPKRRSIAALILTLLGALVLLWLLFQPH